jgi:tRNA A-37 threonylcarbamoyl transferase component Bud32
MAMIPCPRCARPLEPGSTTCPECGEILSPFVRQHAGTLVDGKYRIVRRLGRGGMGEVFEVEHVHLGARRVIKVMRSQIADDREQQARFLREAKLATLIHHPNVATLHDFSVLPDSTCFMVWEYIDGTDLATYARSRDRIATRTVLELVIQALRGLKAVHDAGIVHRDVSPENIMVTTGPSGFAVKLIDLGIAKSESADGSLTSTGVFVGKWRYASPEQIGLIEPGETIDGRADIFSMGVVLYELLSGQLPFQAETPGQYVLLHTGDRPSPVTPDRISVPDAPGLETVLARMLERDRATRYASATEVIADLEEVLRRVSEYDAAPPTMLLTPRPPSAGDVATERMPLEAEAAQTEVTPAPASRHHLLIAAAIAAVGAFVVAAVLLVLAIRFMGRDRVESRAGIATERSAPVGETVEIAAEPEPPAIEPEPVAPQPDTIIDAPAIEEVPPAASQPEPKPAPARPREPRPAPPPPVKEAEPVATPEPPPVAMTDSIPTSGKPMFGRRSRRLVDDPSFKAGFRKGIILDYSDMWSRGGVDWAALAQGIRLADHRIRVSEFRNLTAFDDPAMMRYLNRVLQDQLDDVTGTKETLTTENAIFWAQEKPRHGIGIEMVFRDSSGRTVAKIRHTHFEDSLEDAAQEMVDYIVEFVEDHEVVK